MAWFTDKQMTPKQTQLVRRAAKSLGAALQEEFHRRLALKLGEPPFADAAVDAAINWAAGGMLLKLHPPTVERVVEADGAAPHAQYGGPG